MKRFKEYEEMVDFIADNVEEKDNITCVLHEDTLEDVLVALDEYIFCEVDEINKDISDNQCFYIVTKITNKYREVGLIIEPLCFENTEDNEIEVKDIFGETVIIEDGALEDFEKDEVEFEDELIEVFCDEEIDDCEEDCDDMDEEDSNDNMDDVIDEILNEYVGEIQELGFIGCPHCLKEILDDLCYKIYSEGRDDEALAFHDMLDERLFGEN